MILFVFEGGKAEPMLFESIGKLLLSGEDFRIVKCRHDLPTLYRHLKDNDYDLFRSLPLEESGIEIPDGKRLDTLSDFSLGEEAGEGRALHPLLPMNKGIQRKGVGL